MSYTFDRMSAVHRKDVIRIFNYYIENSFSAYPEEPLPESFFDRILEMTEGYPAFVIRNRTSDRIVGFCFLRPYNPFPTFRETAEISYFIEEQETGKGLGFRALQLLEQEAFKMGIRHILASISSLNTGSISFHRKHGFTECGRFTQIGRKKGKTFDVVWMEKQLISPPVPR